MKTFIFTFFLLASHSFWETKAVLPGLSPKVECLTKLVAASPTFLTDFVELLCKVTEDIPAEERVKNIKMFTDKYIKLVDDCDIFEFLGITPKDLLETTADTATDIGDALLKVSDSLGFTNGVIQLLCKPLSCITKLIKPLPANIASLTDLKCKAPGGLDNFINNLVTLDCLTDNTKVADLPKLLKQLLGDIILKNEAFTSAVKLAGCTVEKIVNKIVG
uniref:Harderin n=1 Tax=Pelophylax lessonae TaxID=45623 RepID=O13162_PELLE|nr:harderin [Rana esculenta] [Pelophylax lessonae]prf//2208263A harderin [Pelophylax lessonae]